MKKKNTKFYANWMGAWAPNANYLKNNHMKLLLMIIVCGSEQKEPTLGGLEPPTLRLTAERANRLRYGNFNEGNFHFCKVSATLSYLARIDKQNIGAVGYKLSWPMTPQLSLTKRGRLRALLSKPQLGLACGSSGMILA